MSKQIFKSHWILLLTTFIIISFTMLLIQHPFDPSDNHEQETMLIIEQNDNLQHNISNMNNINHTAYEIILSNPLNNKQCQNAIIDRYNISKNTFISNYYNESLYKRCKKKRIWDYDGIWSREYIDAISTQNCFIPRLMLRTSLNKQYYNTTNPVFYHIPKSASSSTATMTKNYFNFGSKWVARHEIIEYPYNSTLCGFSFVRDPIKRFISGYYTINAMIFGENELSFMNHTKDKFYKYKFIKIFGEPQRFEMFLNELIERPFDFYKTSPFKHISSQTYFLSNFYGSHVHFIGKV
eukprot:84778_1